jgi:hypothetical protein
VYKDIGIVKVGEVGPAVLRPGIPKRVTDEVGSPVHTVSRTLQIFLNLPRRKLLWCGSAF